MSETSFTVNGVPVRKSMFGVGTIPEWIGMIVLLAGLFWGVSDFISDIQAQLTSQKFEMEAAIQRIENSVASIKQGMEAERRIAVLERQQALSDVKETIAAESARIDRNWKNVDTMWEVIRKNEGHIRELKGQ